MLSATMLLYLDIGKNWSCGGQPVSQAAIALV